MSGARCSQSAGTRWLPALVLLLPGAWAHAGQEEKSASSDRAVIGTNASAAGALLARSAQGGSWKVVPADAPIHAGDELVALPGTRALVLLKDHELKVDLLGLLPELYASSVRESAVRLRPTASGSVVVLLLRGRVVLANRRQQGTASVRVRVLKEAWDVTLEPETVVLLERFNGWRSGVELPRKADGPGPDTHASVVVVQGEARLQSGAEQYRMSGPSLYHWNTAGGLVGPLPLKELPAFVRPRKKPAPQAEQAQAAVKHVQQLLARRPVPDALREALEDKNAAIRRAGVNAAAALGETGLLLRALGDSRHADERADAVVGLRHWVGQDAANTEVLYKSLIEHGYKPGPAGTVLHLLHTFSPLARRRPETYDLLIGYLEHGDLRIRELAAWQLYRLVPQGKDIPYDAAGSADERGRALAAWRRLVPEGQLPLPPKE